MAFRLDCITIILCLSSAAFKRILFLMAQNLISITMFLDIDWTETSWRCFFLLLGFPNMVGHISVSYVNIARIPFSELEADLALRCSFLFPATIFLPFAQSRHSSPSSSFYLSPLFILTDKALGGHRHSFLCFQNCFRFSYVVSTHSGLQFKHSLLNKTFKEYKILHIQTMTQFCVLNL